MSATVDEPAYVAAGYYYWKTHDWGMNTDSQLSPPLIKLLVAFPLLFLDLIPERQEDRFFYQDWTRVDRILFLTRIPVVFLGVILALFVKRWAEELWGPVAGLGALFLYVFEPNILTHSSLATLDMGLTTFTFLSAYYLWKWSETHAPLHKVAAGLMLGFALTSKYTALVFFPIVCLPLFVHRYMRTPRDAARGSGTIIGFLQILIGSVLVVVAVYALIFPWHAVLPGGAQHRAVKRVLARVPWINNPGVQTSIVAIGERIPIPAADHYLEGALMQRTHLAEGHPAFFMGHHSQHGWWYFDLAAFLMKTPIPILILTAVRILALRRLPPTADEYFVMLPIIGIMAVSFLNTVSIGLRYILPLYPFLFVWLGRVIALGICGPSSFGDRTVPSSATGNLVSGSS